MLHQLPIDKPLRTTPLQRAQHRETAGVFSVICFVSEHFYMISTSEKKHLTSIWSVPDALRLKSVILLSNYAPPYLLNWELKKGLSPNRIFHRPCLKRLSIALGNCAANFTSIYSINDTEMFTFKKEMNNSIFHLFLPEQMTSFHDEFSRKKITELPECWSASKAVLYGKHNQILMLWSRESMNLLTRLQTLLFAMKW